MSGRDWADEAAAGIVDLEFTSGDAAYVWLTPTGGEAQRLYYGSCSELMPECAALQREIATALRAAHARGAADEREACAVIADDRGQLWDSDVRYVAEAIRGRGKAPP